MFSFSLLSGYGSAFTPVTKGGAGGSTFDTPGGVGGGVIRILADIVNVDGEELVLIFDY